MPRSDFKGITIRRAVWSWLVREAGQQQADTGRNVTIGDVIEQLISEHENPGRRVEGPATHA